MASVAANEKQNDQSFHPITKHNRDTQVKGGKTLCSVIKHR